MKRTAVLILTHFVNPTIIDTFFRLKNEAPSNFDVYLVLSVGDKSTTTPPEAEIFGDRIYTVNYIKLHKVDYHERCSSNSLSDPAWKMGGNADLMAICFADDHPIYDYIWGIEYDVHFEGSWGFFLSRFEASEADLLGTLIGPISELAVQDMPPAFRDETGSRPSPEDIVAGFFPIFRMSRAMISTLNEAYKTGWNGHYEYTLGTLAKRKGLTIEDIGGDGAFVQPHNKNAFYFATKKRWDKCPGTFVFRPSFSRVQHRLNTLWHPVKPDGNYFTYSPPINSRSPVGWAKSLLKVPYYHAVVKCWFWFKWRPAAENPVPPTKTASAGK